MRASDRGEGHVIEDVGSDDGVSSRAGGLASCAAVEVNGQGGDIKRIEPSGTRPAARLGQNARQDSGQDITGACRRHRRVGIWV